MTEAFDPRTRVLLIVMAILTVASIALTYYRDMVTRDFPVVESEATAQ